MYIKMCLKGINPFATLLLLSILALGGYSFVVVPDSFMSPFIEEDEPSSTEQYPMLSSFELFSITDLLMEITMRPCSFVSRPVMGSIKKFLVAGLSRVPQPQQSNSHAKFYSTYHTLVNCLTRVDEAYSKVKSLSSPFLLNYNNNNNNNNNAGHSTGYLRQKRDSPPIPDIKVSAALGDAPIPTAYDKSQQGDELELESPKDNHLAKHHEFLEELSIIDPSMSFEEFFTLILSITDQTCSQGMEDGLPIEFMVPVLSEVAYWAKAEGSSVYKTAQFKYFHNSHLLEDLRKCERTNLVTPTPKY